MLAASRIAAIAGVALAAASCSLTRVDVAECTSNAECRAEFGFGQVCLDNGRCAAAERFDRCNQTFPGDLFFAPERHRDTIVFGNLMDRSLATHRAREQSARLALKQATDEGGIDLRDIGIVFCTIEEDVEFGFDDREVAAAKSADYLINTLGVPAILGPAASDDVQFVFQNFRDTGTLFISPSATSPALTDLDPPNVTDSEPGMLWRTAPPDSLQGAAIAFDMRAPGLGRTAAVDRVAVIHQVGAYGSALTNVFAQEFQAMDGDATLLPYETEGEMADAIAMAALGDFDEVLFVSSQTLDAIAFMDSVATSEGFDGKGIFLTDAAANPDLLMQANPARFDQVRGTRQAPRDEKQDLVYASFIAAYSSEYGEDVRQFSFTANAYDAAWLLAYAAAWSLFQEDDITGVGMARGLRRISTGSTIETRPTTWNQVVEAFRAGLSIDVSGASGDLDYDPATEETSGDIETWRIEGDKIIGVDTWPPSGGP